MQIQETGRAIPFAHLSVALTAMVVLIGLALYLWRFRQVPGARWQAYVQVCKAAWLVAILMIVQSPLPAERDHWHAAYSILALLVCYCWLRCIAEISRTEQRFAPWFLPALRSVIALYALLAVTNDWHRRYWISVSVENGVEHIHHGPIGYLAHFTGHALIAYSLWLNIRWARSCTGLRRRQAWMFILPYFPAWVGQILSYLPHSRSLEPQSIGFLTTGILVTWAFHRWCVYSIVPLANQIALKSMIEGLMIVDDSGYIVEMNAHARSIFPNPAIRIGGEYAEAVRFWPALADLKEGEMLSDARLEDGQEARYFIIRRIPLQTTPQSILGQVIVLVETTREKRQQDFIVEQQKALATLQERDRLSRELHDGPGQMWSFLAAQSQAVRMQIAKQNYEQADHTLEQLQQVIRDTYIGLRESISGLQTSVSGNLPEALEAQLRWYRDHCGLQTELETGFPWQEGMLSPQVEIQVLRILQEALANVRKSARASRIRISIARIPEGLLFQVEDDGQGFDSSQIQSTGHYGLRMMEERAREIGARLEVDSHLGRGCRLSLSLQTAPYMAEN